MAGTDRFDQTAGTWDLADRRLALAQGVAAAIQREVALSRDLSVLDFGCGTGLVTLALAPLVGSVTGADTSTGMLAALADKAKDKGIPVALRHLPAEAAPGLGGPYHLIVSSMTLHHIADVPALFRLFKQHLRAGGRLALADLDAEDGSFHEDPAGVWHAGFSRADIRTWLTEAGLVDVHVRTATVTRKGDRDYPVFLALAGRAPESPEPVPAGPGHREGV